MNEKPYSAEAKATFPRAGLSRIESARSGAYVPMRALTSSIVCRSL